MALQIHLYMKFECVYDKAFWVPNVDLNTCIHKRPFSYPSVQFHTLLDKYIYRYLILIRFLGHVSLASRERDKKH